MIKIYSDGAYSSSRNRGGWAYVILKDDEKIHHDYGDVFDTTNNRMEIISCMEGLKYCKTFGIKEVTVFSDSMYLIGTMSKSWRRNKNQDLWIEMEDVISGLSIEWKHTKGHANDKWNNYCDMLASFASTIVE